jgi:hypothetical protein
MRSTPKTNQTNDARQRESVVRNIWSEQLPPGDPIFTGGVRLVFDGPSSDVTPEEEELVGFVSPNVREGAPGSPRRGGRMSEPEQTEVRFFVGEWVPTVEFVERLRQLEEHEDDE